MDTFSFRLLRVVVSTLREFWEYTVMTRKITLFFLVLILVLMGFVILLTESPALMPYIYALF